MRHIKEAQAMLDTLFNKNYSFVIKESGNTPIDILNGIVECMGVIHDNLLWEFKNNIWAQAHPTVELLASYSNMMLEGDIILKGESLTFSYSKSAQRIGEELKEITTSMQAYYDLQIDVYGEEDIKLYTVDDEVQVSLDEEGYKVDIIYKESHWARTPSSDRYSTLDYTDSNADSSSIEEDPRFSGLDMDPKGAKVKKVKEKPIYRYQDLDLNNYNIRNGFESLLFQQDTQQSQAQTAQQKLGKQVATQQVSKSIQSQVDKMSYQKAYDMVEDAKKAWDDTDAYHQYVDTVELASNWYQNNCVQVSGFDVIDKSYYAADLMRKIASLEDSMAHTKSRSALAKMSKELEQVKGDLNKILPEIKDVLKGATGQDEVDARTKELEKRKEEYSEVYRDNLAEWKAIKDKMEKAGKLIETMEALKVKYASQYDLPPLLSRYKELIATQVPNLIDVDSLEEADAGLLYTAWRQSMIEFRKELENFNDSFRANYDVLARVLALKAKSRSLF